MRVLVTGAGGQLGLAMVGRLAAAHDVTALSRADLDITRHEDVMRAVAGARPHAVVNCAAYNAVDRAEDDAGPALACNAMALRSLARAAAAAGAVLVHYSTDFVFDGEADSPYDERAATGPRSVYGQSKLIGEWFAFEAPRHYVLRVESLFGGPLPRSSIDRIAAALRQGQTARVFTDRTVSPSYVDDVAGATIAMLENGAPSGLYHCVNTGHATWHEVGLEIARLLGCEPRLEPTSMQESGLRAPRPRYCALSNARLAALGIRMPAWQDALSRYLQPAGR